MKELSGLRQAKETELTTLQRLAASLDEQKRMMEVLRSRLDETRQRCDRMHIQARDLAEERTRLQERIALADRIEKTHQRWQADRLELERLDQVAANFHEINARRSTPLAVIAAEQSRLEEERRTLAARAGAVDNERARLDALLLELPVVLENIQAVQGRLAQRAELEAELQALQQQAAGGSVENAQLESRDERLARAHRQPARGGRSRLPVMRAAAQPGGPGSPGRPAWKRRANAREMPSAPTSRPSGRERNVCVICRPGWRIGAGG